MFEFAPIAMAISTSDTETSSYLKVNDAYLRLTGLKWDDIRGKTLTSEGSAISSPARDRRHRLLAEDGGYVLEEVDLRHADGTILPTLISAQRTVIDGVSFDVEVIVDVSARVRHQNEIELALRASARTDALSGLPNRACFDEVIAEYIARMDQSEKLVALAFIDFNGFKAVNDTMGHVAGDEVLRTIASRFRDSFRANDFIARIGGDEFAVILEIDEAYLNDVELTLNEAIDRIFKPVAVDGIVTEVGAAVGVTLLQQDDDAMSLMKRADSYMYLAKQTGDRIALIWLGQPGGGTQMAKRAAQGL
ncbi:sensor domain-containing diguanylate cyclase [Rhizobium sp. S96]|uniref:GGDEF domain-containing protein n=1 Tax=Rhizobium sp. S96 TaxID=3055140 RepID=UPI0025AAF87F|nr:sensor domain-containing diguanylate cyclase [Rhizobium sp. S96]MDM9624249.1 sensor domain-containing diguanylate cyclase [Rhizobium sp. S96]